MKRKKYSKSLQVNQVRITFTNKPITAWGGIASLVAKFLEKIDFRSWVEKNVPVIEVSNNSRGVYEKILALFLVVLIGGRRFAHLLWYGNGIEVFLKALDVEWLPKAASTLTRFWGKINTQGLSNRLGEGARGLAQTLIGWEGITADNLNLDSTVLTRYGQQQGAKRGYNPKKRGRPSHHPLLAFIGSGYIVNLWNRSGNTHSGQRAVDFFRQTVKSLGEEFAIRRVLCDIGFYQIDFIKHLEKHNYHYIISVPISEIMQKQIHHVSDWEKVEEGIEVAEFEFEHLDSKWTKKRRYVVVRQEVPKRPKALGKQPKLFKDMDEWKEYRFSLIITNVVNLPALDIWREYRPRANDENVLKDLKEGYAFEAFNMHNFWSTEAVMIIIAMAFHNLIHYLNRNVLCIKSPQQQMRTLRFRYLIIPGQLGSSGGYDVLRLAVRDRRLRGKLIYFLERINRIQYSLNCNAVGAQNQLKTGLKPV